MSKRLIIICQRFPFPARRGDQLAVSKMIKTARQAEIEVKCYFVTGGTSIKSPGLEYIKLNFSIKDFLMQSYGVFLQPLQLTLFSGYRVKDLSDNDVIYIHTIRLANSVPREAWSTVCLAPQIDFSAEFIERSNSASNCVLGFIYKLEAILIKRWQCRNFHKFSKLFRVVGTEFGDYTNVNFITSPHGFLSSRVDLNTGRSKFSKRITIGFWGNFAFQPNMDAANNLLNELADDSRFEILIFGHNSKKLKVEARNVKLLGSVVNVDAHIRECDALLNLVQTGGGFQNKTVEAWAQGIPVFGHEQAFRGLDGISAIKHMYDGADKLYDELTQLDRTYFAKLSTAWVLDNWNEERNATAKLVELGFKL